MFIQKYWALFLLPAVAGVVIAIILLSKKTDDTIASPAEDVDLDKKYNSAYRLYKQMHLQKYPDCTQAQVLEAEAKRPCPIRSRSLYPLGKKKRASG